MDSIAYALRAEIADDYVGGVLAVENGASFDVVEELKKGDGQIVVDPATDPILVIALDDYSPLERVPVKAAKKADKADKNKEA